MDNRTGCCRNLRCTLYGHGAPLAQLKVCAWHVGAARFQCRAGRQRVAARPGTASTGIPTAVSTSLRGAVALAEGVRIRATGRLLWVDKDTVNHWLPLGGRHCQGVMNYFFRNLHLSECQLGELWPFLAKKEAHLTPLEQLQEVYGDAGGWSAFSPVCKLVPTWVVGKRTLPQARRLVFRLKAATDGHLPFVTSDELPHYVHARLDVYGQWVPPPRQGTRGRFPKPRRMPPPDLCDAGVGKERENGRGVEVTTRIVYGTTEQGNAALRASPVSGTSNTSAVERNNLTVRQHARRMGRKVKAFSQDPHYLEQQLTSAFAYYHLVVPHHSLRQRLRRPLLTKGRKGSRKKWKPATPAMAAGLTDHVWTRDALLSFRVPPQHLWCPRQ